MLGKSFKAVAFNQDAAELMGINGQGMVCLAYALSAAVAGFGGMLIGPIVFPYSTMGTIIGLKAFGVAMIGGLGSAYGIIICALGYGILEFAIARVFSTAARDFGGFLLIILVLSRYPRGSSGRGWSGNSYDGPSGSRQQWPPHPKQIPGDVVRGHWPLSHPDGCSVLCSEFVLSFHVGSHRPLHGCGCGAEHSRGLHRAHVTWACGILCHRRLHGGVPCLENRAEAWIAVGAGVVVSACFGFVLANANLKVQGPYLAMLTLAFGVINFNLSNELRPVTGGPMGLLDIPYASIGGSS